jgi:hypothetical protein
MKIGHLLAMVIQLQKGFVILISLGISGHDLQYLGYSKRFGRLKILSAALTQLLFGDHGGISISAPKIMVLSLNVLDYTSTKIHIGNPVFNVFKAWYHFVMLTTALEALKLFQILIQSKSRKTY